MSEEITTQDVVDKLQKAKWVMMTSRGAQGKLVSHPMVPQEITDSADTWYFISLTGDQARALHNDPEINISHAEAGTWLSVSARVEFVEDRAKVDELWNSEVDSWFDGKNDPSIGLIKATADSAQYWGVPGGKVATLAQMVKSRITDKHESGDSKTIDL